MKKDGRASRYLSDIGFYLDFRKKNQIFNKEVNTENNLRTFSSLFNRNPVKITELNDEAIQLCYEELLLETKQKKRFSHKLYPLFEDELNIEHGDLNEKVLSHMGKRYLKALGVVDCCFTNRTRYLRYLVKAGCFKDDCLFFAEDSEEKLIREILSFLKGKKVLLLSDHAELFQVQFSRFHVMEKTKELYDFSLLSLDPYPILKPTDRSNYVESSDALNVSLLQYAYDVLLVHDNAYAMDTLLFSDKLSSSCLVLGSSLYHMFGIKERNSEKMKDEELGYISLEDYDATRNQDFIASNYLADHPLIDQDKKTHTEEK